MSHPHHPSSDRGFSISRRGLAGAAVVAAVSTAVSACAKDLSAPASTGASRSGSAAGSQSSPAAGQSSGSASSAGSSAPSKGSDCWAAAAELSLEARCGQLLMVGLTDPRPPQSLLDQFATLNVGFALVLGERIRGRVTMSALASQLSGVNAKLPLVIAADQEGGQVQRLKGSGFSPMPSAVTQSQWDEAELTAKWTTWAGELRRAGVLWNLAPVGDVVPRSKQSSNQPIGRLQRGYGSTAEAAAPHVVAADQAMRAAKVATSVKHFPGLGQVTTNTDFGEALDTVTTADSPEVETFRAAIKAGTSSVMVASAVYRKIDPDHRAVFSSKVITDLLRSRLGFNGLVISDDLGAAQSVAEVPTGERATRFVAAGGDVVICADPAKAKPMVDALIARAKDDEQFAAQVIASAGRVLALKSWLGVLEQRCS